MVDKNCDYIVKGKSCAAYCMEESFEKDWKCDEVKYEFCPIYIEEIKNNFSQQKDSEKGLLNKD